MEKWLKYCKVLSFILPILCFLSLLLPCGAYVYGDHIDYLSNGYHLIFGRKDGNYVIYHINIVGIILLLLLMVSAVLAILLRLKDTSLFLFKTVVSLFSIILILLLPITIRHASEMVKELFVVYYGIYVALALASLDSVLSLVSFWQAVKKQTPKK